MLQNEHFWHCFFSNWRKSTVICFLQALNSARQDLRSQEQLVRQLTRQKDQLELDKQSLQTNVRDAENALRTAAR